MICDSCVFNSGADGVVDCLKGFVLEDNEVFSCCYHICDTDIIHDAVLRNGVSYYDNDGLSIRSIIDSYSIEEHNVTDYSMER